MRHALSIGLMLLCLGTVEGGGRDGAEPEAANAARTPLAVERIAAYVAAHRRARSQLQTRR